MIPNKFAQLYIHMFMYERETLIIRLRSHPASLVKSLSVQTPTSVCRCQSVPCSKSKSIPGAVGQ